MMEPGPARAKANWLRLFSRVRLQLQEVYPLWSHGFCILSAVFIYFFLWTLTCLIPLSCCISVRMSCCYFIFFHPSFYISIIIILILWIKIHFITFYLPPPPILVCHFIIFFSVVCHLHSHMHVVHSDYQWLDWTFRLVWSSFCLSLMFTSAQHLSRHKPALVWTTVVLFISSFCGY